MFKALRFNIFKNEIFEKTYEMLFHGSDVTTMLRANFIKMRIL